MKSLRGDLSAVLAILCITVASISNSQNSTNAGGNPPGQFWHSDSTDSIIDLESKIKSYKSPYDGVSHLPDSVQERIKTIEWYENSYNANQYYTDILRAEVLFQRGNEARILRKVLEACCQDTIGFYLSMLKDSAFYSHCGAPDEAIIWYYAVENLAIIGKPAIPGLIEKLDSSDKFERTQALASFKLAIQNKNVKAICGKDRPWTFQQENDGMTDEEQIVAAKAWYKKYENELLKE